MKRLVLLFTVLGVAAFLFAYAPVTISINIDTSADNSEGGVALNGAGEAQAATRTGTDGDDTLTGTTYRDYLNGRGGKDILSGGGGNDVIAGDSGGGQPQGDTIYGQDGADDLVGGGGVDTIHGGTGDDVITAGDETETAPNGEADIIDCGSGYGDFVFTDPSDQTKNCENISQDWFVIQATS
jgi:Ca2+-binding RTX toxin-like protein